METSICIGDISCWIKKSKRARVLRLNVYSSGKVVVTEPFNYDRTTVEKFVLEKEDWIKSKLEIVKNKINSSKMLIDGDYYKDKQKAMELVKNKIFFYNQFYLFPLNKFTVKNQSQRWGSCSSKKNININYRVLYLPEELCDYIIVHELCHLKELNHSHRFWNLVGMQCPNYKKLRAKLKEYKF